MPITFAVDDVVPSPMRCPPGRAPRSRRAAESFGHPSEHLFLAPVADLGPDDPRWLGMAVDGAIGLVDPRRRQQPADRPAFTATRTLAGAGSSDA